MFSALDIAEAVTENNFDLHDFLEAYYSLGARFELGWVREQIKEHRVLNHWEALARAAFRDDLDQQQRSLTVSILKIKGELNNLEVIIEAWINRHQGLVQRWMQMVQDLKAAVFQDYTMYSVALRELLDLAQCAVLEVETQTGYCKLG